MIYNLNIQSNIPYCRIAIQDSSGVEIKKVRSDGKTLDNTIQLPEDTYILSFELPYRNNIGDLVDVVLKEEKIILNKNKKVKLNYTVKIS